MNEGEMNMQCRFIPIKTTVEGEGTGYLRCG